MCGQSRGSMGKRRMSKMVKFVVLPLALVMLIVSASFIHSSNTSSTNISSANIGIANTGSANTKNPGSFGVMTRFSGFYALPKDSLEAVFVGPSSVYRGWSAPCAYNQFGLASYPLASVAQFPMLIKYMMIEALKYQHPQVFVVDLRRFRTDIDNDLLTRPDAKMVLQYAVLDMRNSKNRVATVKAIGNELLKRNDFTKMDEQDIINGIGTPDTNGPVNLPEASLSATDDPYRGFVFSPTVKKQSIDPGIGQITACLPLPQSNMRVLTDLLSFCMKKRLQVLFIDTPYKITPIYQELNNEMKAVIMGCHYPGFKVFDGNKAYNKIGLNASTDFRDNLHLNIRGTFKFTDYLGNYIMKAYGLKDCRNDPAYSGWDASYAAWLAKARSVEAKMPA